MVGGGERLERQIHALDKSEKRLQAPVAVIPKKYFRHLLDRKIVLNAVAKIKDLALAGDQTKVV
jgi:hypothetical protein